MDQSVKLRKGPGSVELPRSPAPIVKADALLYAHFERPELARARDYLVDFGLSVVAESGDALYLRGAGSNPYIYRVSRGATARFVGFGLSVPSAEDLKRLANASGRPVEATDGPGGGSVVRLVDPQGVAVCAHHGFAAAEPQPVRDPIPHNAPSRTVRVNDTQRPALAPPQVTKLGHLVLETPDFDRSARWYMDILGFIPSDVMCLPDGTPIGAFMRLDRGDEPSDHHTLFVATGLESKVDHVAFEVVDLDAVEMGQQILMAKRYRHAWGVGRHLLGSQIFDYWRDPWGQKHEHYADGDLFDAAQPAGYHVLDRAGLYQWGPDLPDDFVDAKLTPRRLLNVLKLAVSDRPRLKKMLALKSSVAKPARPWR
jgi:catechol 2,3-dioxygenase-like lactoylglutathione lyase family enzyme